MRDAASQVKGVAYEPDDDQFIGKMPDDGALLA
jgi:hypothetical protein